MKASDPVAIGVAASYRHKPKQVRPGDPLENAHCQLKWYDLYPAELGIPDNVLALARRVLVNGAIQADGLGFSILHRREPPHLPTFCVWELAIVEFEKDAWLRFLTSARQAVDVGRWLEDRYHGLA